MCRILVYILKAILIRETKKVVQLLIQTSVWGASWDIIGLLMRLSGDAWSKYAQFGVDDCRLFIGYSINLKLEKQESVDYFAFVKAMPHPFTGLKLNRVHCKKEVKLSIYRTSRMAKK